MSYMLIVSVDDHISKPPALFYRHLSGYRLASAPKLRCIDAGTDYWEYQGEKFPSVGLNAVVGRPARNIAWSRLRSSSCAKAL